MRPTTPVVSPAVSPAVSIDELPLVCPACRTRDEAGRHMHTLAVAGRFAAGAAGGIVEGALRCENASCGRTYPIVDGLPIVVPEPAAFFRGAIAQIVEGALSPEIEGLLAAPGPDDAPWTHLIEHLSIYMDAHWGDRAAPPPDGPGEPFGMRAIAERLAARAGEARVARAAELGASVGRGLAELARGADLTVGVELHFGALRRARRMLGGEVVRYARKIAGRNYRPVEARAGALASDRVALVCADALDPPLVPGSFDRVAALNVLDSVPEPAQLLSVADGLLAPGGELILACPYAFQSGVVSEEARFGGADPAAWLRARLAGGEGLEAPYAIEDEAELPWSLRRDARSAHTYAVHWLRARKGG